MRECFDLAKTGLGRTSPNPIVGAIVLDKDGKPIGKGYHQIAGGNHAEVNAIKEAGSLTKEGTLIVNLEPCCHVGKTQPCTDLIIKSRLKEVIFSNFDPNPIVYKKGENILSNLYASCHNRKVIFIFDDISYKDFTHISKLLKEKLRSTVNTFLMIAVVMECNESNGVAIGEPEFSCKAEGRLVSAFSLSLCLLYNIPEVISSNKVASSCEVA